MGRVIPGVDFARLSLLGDFFSPTPGDVTLLDGRVVPNLEKWKAAVPLLKGDPFTYADFTPAQLMALRVSNNSAQLWAGLVKTGAVTLSSPITDFKLIVVELSLDVSTPATTAATKRTALILSSSLSSGLKQPLITLIG